MTNKISFSELEKCGWFEGYPASLRDTVKEKVEGEEKAYGLALAGGDAECINQEGDYVRYYINDFAAASRGLFSPEGVSEKWRKIDDYTSEVTLSFRHENKDYNISFEQPDDYMNPLVLELINRVLEDGGTPLRLIKLEIGSQDEYYALTTLDAYIKAYRSNLLPKWNLDPFDEALWSSEPESLSLSWHLKKIKTTDRKASQKPMYRFYGLQASAKHHLRRSVRNLSSNIKKTYQVHMVFVASFALLNYYSWEIYRSLLTSSPLDSANLGIVLSRLFIWAFSYKICLDTDRRAAYLLISLCALYFVLFGLPMIGWVLVMFMYLSDKIRLRKFKKELRAALEETGSNNKQ